MKDLIKIIIMYCTKLKYNKFMFKILRKISFRYKVYTSFTHIAHLSDRAVILTSELQEIYGKTRIKLIPYTEGKYAKIKYENITITKNNIKEIMNNYNECYFEDVSIKMTKKYIKLYINFNY